MVRYLLALVAWTLACQALLASAPMQATMVVPFARWQGVVVERYVLGAPLTVSVDPSCSGLEVIALCLAATLAYPVAWSQRLVGATAGVAILLALNLVRIATLAGASQTVWFQTFHVNVWPTVLVLAAAAWIAVWMRLTNAAAITLPSATVRRFTVWSVVMLAIYGIAVSVLTDWHVLDHAARGAANITGGLLSAFGADVTVTERVLQVRDVQYLITPECVSTPLIAFYFAALIAAPLGWRLRAIGLIASLPVFAALAIARLLTVAVPLAVAGTTLILTHAFNQILTGIAILIVASLWLRGDRSPARALTLALLASAGAVAVSVMAGLGYAALWSRVLDLFHLTAPPALTPHTGDGDGQGALLILPIFQIALFGAAWTIARGQSTHARWALACLALIVSQFLFLAMQGWMHAEGIRPFSVLAIRGWAVIVPVMLITIVGRTPAKQSSPTLEKALA